MESVESVDKLFEKREKIEKLWKIQGFYGGRKTKKYPQNFDAENHIKTVDIVDN